MLASFVLLSTLLLANAAPVTLNQAATAEAQQRDNTATRAFSAQPIKAANGQCLSVDPLSGDFRENLIPVQLKACDGSANQQFDVLTAGKHNNVAGQALVVSSLTQGCLNFDPRRAAGDQVNLFSCGGRGDGSGQVATSQLFAFTGASSLALQPQNGKGSVCLAGNASGRLDQAGCNGSAGQVFVIGNGKAAATAKATTAAATTKAATTAAATTAKATTTAATASTATEVAGAGGTLNPSAVAESQQRDNTAVRAFSGARIKAANGQCLSVDPLAGDFRENLIPVQLKACDGSAGQQFDIITSGKHNNVKGQALFVSSLTQGCLNFDPRRAAGDQVNLFSCGGHADGEGAITDSQLFAFSGATTLAIQPQNGKGAVCLVDNNGRLDQTSCNASAAQNFVIGNGAAQPANTATASTKATAAAATTKATTAAATTKAATTAAATTNKATTTAASTVTKVAGAGGTLNPSAVAESQQRDNTAVRAFSGAPIKAANGQCLSVDPLAGDFRENLIPVQLKACDGSAGQQFDIITSGKHNNVAGQALFVSSLTQGCLNFDPRRAAGDQVNLFSCGGRADGQGAVTDSQLFAFGGKTNLAIQPQNGKGSVCLINNNGRLDRTSCNGSSAQLFTIGASATK